MGRGFWEVVREVWPATREQRDGYHKTPKRSTSCPSVQGPAKRTLLVFFDFPAEHWKHLRTSNPIESRFATVRLRQRVTKGAGGRAKALIMAFKVLMLAQERWRSSRVPICYR